MSRRLLILISSVLAAACGGNGGSDPPPGGATAVAKPATGSGDAQTGTVGQPLASPIQVVVTQSGTASSGVTVNWSTPAVNGTVAPPSSATSADGLASSGWTLGTVSGAQTAQAAVTGATGSPVTFTATAVADAAATITAAGGDGQTGETNSLLELPVQARVRDQFGNSVAGTSVNWTAAGAVTSAPTVVTDAAGISQVNVTLGSTAGPITIVAEAAGLTGSPVTFNATAVAPAPAPATIAITVDNNLFRSNRNASTNPAVDTVAVGGTVTWTWAPTAASHDVSSFGSPSFTGSAIQAAPASHSFTFPAAGTYRYFCSVHAAPGASIGMVGRIVVR